MILSLIILSKPCILVNKYPCTFIIDKTSYERYNNVESYGIIDLTKATGLISEI